VVVLVVVLLCLTLTLQARPLKNKQQKVAEDDSDEHPSEVAVRQQQPSKRKNDPAPKNPKK
jgi:hypothetical protein